MGSMINFYMYTYDFNSGAVQQDGTTFVNPSYTISSHTRPHAALSPPAMAVSDPSAHRLRPAIHPASTR